MQKFSFPFSIIVPVQQDAFIFDLFLKSLAQTISKPSQIIFIEDGSQPGLRSLFNRFEEEAPLDSCIINIKNDIPHGYAKSVNRALQMASGEIITLVDSDVILLPGWQEGFEAEFSNCPDAGAIGAKLLYPQSGGIQHCGLAFSEDMVRHLWLNSPSSMVIGSAFPVQAVVFALCAIRKIALEASGLLDECYFNGYEDLDFCLRVRSAGFKVLVAPEVTAYHWECSSGLHRDFNRRRNLGRFWRLRGNSIEPDIWKFLIDSLRAKLIQEPSVASGWVLIDLCEDRTDIVCLKKAIYSLVKPIYSDLNYSFRVDSGGDIWLPRVLGNDSHREPSRYMFVVHNMVRLTANKYWWELRKVLRDDDIVVDLYGNAIYLRELISGSWPGSKVR